MIALSEFKKMRNWWTEVSSSPNTYFLVILGFSSGIAFFIYAHASGELASLSALIVVADTAIYQEFRRYLGAWTAVAALALLSGILFGGVADLNGQGFWVYGVIGALVPIPTALFLFFTVGMAKGARGIYRKSRSMLKKG